MNRTISRTFFGFLLPLILSLVIALPVAAIAPGDLDTTFDTDGRVTTDFGGNDVSQAVAIQSDGKIVAVGVTHTSTSLPLGDFAVVRYNANGSLDTTFGTGGKVTTKFGSGGRDQAWAVAIYKTGPYAGKILAVGDTTAFGANRFALARYNADGSLDTSFDTDGKVTTDFRTAPDDIYPAAQGLSVALQSDGKIVVAGSFFKFYSTGSDFALARYNADGSLDTSFGGTGKVITDIGGFPYGSGDAAYSVAIQSDGKIVAAGHANPLASGNTDFAVARYNANGSLDTTFDTDGKVTTDFGTTNDVGRSMAIQSNGKIVVAGEAGSYPSADFALARYNTDGSLDTTFDTDGKVTTNFLGWDLGQGVAIQSDGGIVVAGHTQNVATYALDFAVARYNANGSLDSSFGVGGKVTTDFGGGPDAAHSVAIQSDGKIVLAGSGGGGTGDFALARYGGTPVPPANSPPVANNDAYVTSEGATLNIPAPGVLGNDSDPDGNPLTALLVAPPANGAVVLNTNGSFTYTPNANFVGIDSFTYKANDGTSDSNIATVTVTVNAVQPPRFLNDKPLPDLNANICLPPFMVQDPSSTHFWWARATGAGNLEIILHGIAVNAAESGQVIMTVIDPAGSVVGTRTVNQPPSGETLAPPLVITGATLGSLYKIKIGIIRPPSGPVARHYTLTLKGASLLGANSPLQAQAENDNANWAVNVASGESLNVLVQGGPEAPATTGSVHVRNPSGALVTTVPIGTAVNIPFAAAGMWTISIVGADHHYVIDKTSGTDRGVYVTWMTWGFGDLSGVITRAGQPNTTPVTVRLTNTLTSATQDIAAIGNYSVPKLPVGSYSVALITPPNLLQPSSQTINITCHGVFMANFDIPNRPPTAANDTYTVNEDSSLAVPGSGVLANDSDPDTDPLKAVLLSGPSHGVLALSANGSFTYTPAANYNGGDTFSYKANDGFSDSNVATVTITVSPVNDPPVAVNDNYTSDVYAGLTVGPRGVLSNDTDIDSSLLTAILVTGPTKGTLTLNSDGSFTYTPGAGFDGYDSFTYKANDGSADSNTATVNITASVTYVANGKITAGVLRFGNNGRGGFNVQSDANGAIKGELEYHNGSVNLHAHTMTAIAVSPDRTRGWFAGVLTDGRRFTAYVEDNGEPGNTDVFRLWVEGVLQNGDGKLTGGNVQIHHQ